MTNRRNFLKASFSAAGAAVAGSAWAVPVKAPSKWDESFDFVIIGAGGAGLSAACHAAEAGLKVLVLEKMSLVGDLHLSAAVLGLLEEPSFRSPKASKTARKNSSPI